MARWVSKGRRSWAGAAACLLGLGCGGTEASNSLFEPEPVPPGAMVAPMPEAEVDDVDEMMVVTPPPTPDDMMNVDTPTPVPPIPTEEEPVDDGRCQPANGVPGR